MRKCLDIVIVICLLGLLVPQTVGFTITRCAHSGHISLAKFSGEMDCGMGSDASCMQHFTFKVSEFSTLHAGVQLDPPQLTAVLFVPFFVLGFPDEGHSFRPVVQASPPGSAFHTLIPLRN